ncbi:MAG TPA: hypothetical protein VMT22_17315 [Terriglobales bacterium]|jgi:hypothetical protein|nr:hypothetical protein [Terriglobales bacterium]
MGTNTGGTLLWWRQFLGFGSDGVRKAVEILSDQYVDAARDAARLKQEAQRMQYPQFRDKLLAIAAQRANHADLLSKKLESLNGRVPRVAQVAPTDKNSWQYLLEELDEQQRDAAELSLEARELQPEMPEIARLLERILEDGKVQRAAIREMLMKSDPQSGYSA